jgi:hypothetical protein
MTSTILDSQMPGRQLMNLLKEYLEQWDSDRLSHDVNRHYRILRLMDSRGNYKVKPLEKFAGHLSQDDIGTEQVHAFLDQVGENIDANSCLRRFLLSVEWRRYPTLLRKIADEGPKIIPDAVSFAMALQKLTEALYQDYRLMSPLLSHWENERREASVNKYMTMFWKVKRASIKYPLEKMIEFHESGEIPAGFLGVLLPFNILEAAAADLLLGFSSNAKTGWTLAVNRPYKLRREGQTQARTTAWSQDKKAFNYNLPLPQMWADLYQSWNLAFITTFRDFPFAFAKLLIPAVSGYRDHPREYLYHRKLALFIYIYYAGFYRSGKAQRGEVIMDWSDHELTRFWGEVNGQSAREYALEKRAHFSAAPKV